MVHPRKGLGRDRLEYLPKVRCLGAREPNAHLSLLPKAGVVEGETNRCAIKVHAVAAWRPLCYGMSAVVGVSPDCSIFQCNSSPPDWLTITGRRACGHPGRRLSSDRLCLRKPTHLGRCSPTLLSITAMHTTFICIFVMNSTELSFN